MLDIKRVFAFVGGVFLLFTKQLTKEFLLFSVAGRLIEFSTDNDGAMHVQFFFGTLPNSIFDRVGRQQTQNANHIFLTDSMCTSLCLEISVWVPITVENDDCVSCLKINAKATGASG
eukprot:GABV01004544.1.p1 GENE.GABV01004544.1~~GABV01004544.1.p1  ORF type:complete len:125 (+),score=40.26 GABV01004544.1:27-377(+)